MFSLTVKQKDALKWRVWNTFKSFMFVIVSSRVNSNLWRVTKYTKRTGHTFHMGVVGVCHLRNDYSGPSLSGSRLRQGEPP